VNCCLPDPAAVVRLSLDARAISQICCLLPYHELGCKRLAWSPRVSVSEEKESPTPSFLLITLTLNFNMAPFAIFTHRSFRRGASSQSTPPSDSATAQQKTAMGGVPSKAASSVNEAPHKKLRPRSSSMNLLKRNRTPSANTAARTSTVTQPSASIDTTTIEVFESEADYTRISLARRSDSESTVKTLSDSVHSNRFETIKDDSFESDASSTRTTTRVTAPSDELVVLGADDEPSGMSTPVPPRSLKTPQIQLPTPSFLTEDSPTKYGLRVTQSPSLDLFKAATQRQKMTGAGLFVVCDAFSSFPCHTA
jgi:hypothetical protein